ncbi:MAG: LamG-like jellyroll fold domain-containing protein, partial [Elusimicrobiota bacterium]
MSHAALAVVLLSLVAVPARAGPEIDTPSSKIVRNAADQAGSTVAFTSFRLNGALGEASGPVVSLTSFRLYPGLMGIASFPGLVSDFSAAALSSVSVRLAWSAPGVDGALGALAAGSSYHVQSSSVTPVSWAYSNAQVSISTSGVSPGDAQSSPMPGLQPNTTYFFGLWTQDAQGNLSFLSNGATVATLAPPLSAPAPAFLMVGVDSVTAQWTPLPASPSSTTAEGYELDASTASDFTGTILSSRTSGVAPSTLTISGLFSNTTYYFRVGSLNWAGIANFEALGSTLTLASVDATPPSDVADLAAATNGVGSVLLSWSGPSDPGNSPLSGTYAIQYATWTGVAWSTSGAQVSFSTSGVISGAAQARLISGLDPNTTYFFSLWTADAKPNWSALSNGATAVTLANPVTNIQTVALGTSAVTLGWAALPMTPSSATAEGYRLEASSTNFSALAPGGLVYSSATTNVAASTLSVSGLAANTTYYFRVASLNWTQTTNYALAGPFSTLAVAPTQLASDFLDVFPTSATARWAARPIAPSSATCEGYTLEASSTNFGALTPGGAVYSSVTAGVLASTLIVSGLAPNTTYYFRVGALNWNAAANYTTLSATSTLANAPAAPAYTAATNVSLAAQWGADDDPPGTAFTFQLSTASNFTGTIFSSVTVAVSALRAALAPDTTYYGRVFATNNNGVLTSYSALGATATLASSPLVVSPAFNPVFFSSLTALFANGVPANPDNTLYDVQLSSFSNFNVFYTSRTLNLAAAFTGLSPNTTYYAQAAALNRSGIATAFTALGSTATLAVAPGPVVTTYTAITANSFTMSWSSGTPTPGYNPDGTTYAAQISTASNFTGALIESVVTATSTDFGGLLSGTLYYGRVQAINYQGVASTFTAYGSATTLPSAVPSFLADSFRVGDSLGSFLDPALYTDTTTPTLQVQVQSNFAPGLSVTDTPSHLALWHMDEGAGASSVDSARHGYTLALTGAPAPTWTAGKLGGALQFDGTQNYALSPTVAPTGWRSSAANNQFSVALWFNTGQAKGFLFQVANANTVGGAGTYDAELSWQTASGKLTFEITNTAGTRSYAPASQAYNNNAWHFAVGVLNTAGFYLYVDGALAASNTTVNSTTARLYPGPTYLWTGAASIIGATLGGTGGARYYPGKIDEVLVATVAFTAAQVSQLYNLASAQTHAFGAPCVDLSTSAGANNSWTRLSTNTFALTGANATTAAQLWTSTLALQTPLLVQTASPGAATNQVMFLEDSLDAQLTTAQFTVLVDTTPPPAPAYSSLTTPTTFGLDLNGLSGADALSGLNAAPFRVQASTDQAFGVVNADSGWTTGPGFTFTTLLPNTTYFARARDRDAAGSQGNQSAFSAAQSLATLAVTPSTFTPAFLGVFNTSATLAWVALPPTPSSRSAQGYRLDASTASDFSGTLYSSATTSVAASTLTIPGLAANTTYFFRVGSINHAGLLNNITLASTSTLANAPATNPPAFLAVFQSSITAQWAALPASPQSASAEGYLLEASSTNFSALAPGGLVYSSATASLAASTLTLTALDTNTTYYFRVAGLNWNQVPAYTVLGTTGTLAGPVLGPSPISVFISSVAVAWGALPATPSSSTAEGYRLDASTAADFNATILSSFTPNVALSTLSVSGLFSNTTYYFRVGTLNWGSAINYTQAGSTLTLASVDATPPSAVADLAAATNGVGSVLLSW